MSPEQARGIPVDKRGDIWAFGCCLFEALTQNPPFQGKTTSDTLAKILEREPEWNLLPGNTPPKIRDLLRRCLEKDVRERLRDIGDARIELQHAIREIAAPSVAKTQVLPDTGFKAILLTQIVDWVELKQRLGVAISTEAIDRHDALFHECVKQCNGLEKENLGDGFLAVFDLPSDAVRCAMNFQQGVAKLDLPEPIYVRIGIHAGEIARKTKEKETQHSGVSDDPVVHTAMRVMGLAQSSQILLTSGAFDSARQRLTSAPDGSLIEWLAHGAYHFEGTDRPIQICEAGIKDRAPLAPPSDSSMAKRAIAPSEKDTLGWRPAAGRTIPGRAHWMLQSQVGEGGFGEVWIASHEKTKEKRIFKFCFQAERVRGLKREVVLFRLLKETLGDRDDIARILDWQFDKPPYFLEAEYTKAGDLAEWAGQQGGITEVPLETRLEIVAQAAVALGAAHSVGVLHKDIKPANLLITENKETGEPRVSLTDFGIGLLTDREALAGKGITATGLTQTLVSSESSSGSGTRLYMAPELIERKPATTLSDIYSLGVVLYQVVIGDFSRAVAPGWERDVPDELLREDIGACVEGVPERRLTSASEVAERLRRLEQRRADRARQRSRKTSRNRVGKDKTSTAAPFGRLRRGNHLHLDRRTTGAQSQQRTQCGSRSSTPCPSRHPILLQWRLRLRKICVRYQD